MYLLSNQQFLSSKPWWDWLRLGILSLYPCPGVRSVLNKNWQASLSFCLFLPPSSLSSLPLLFHSSLLPFFLSALLSFSFCFLLPLSLSFLFSFAPPSVSFSLSLIMHISLSTWTILFPVVILAPDPPSLMEIWHLSHYKYQCFLCS